MLEYQQILQLASVEQSAISLTAKTTLHCNQSIGLRTTRLSLAVRCSHQLSQAVAAAVSFSTIKVARQQHDHTNFQMVSLRFQFLGSML